MRVGLTAVLTVVLGGSFLLTPVPAGAVQPSSDDTDRARKLYRAGEKAYKVGKFADAVAQFEEAYQLSGLPIILYNIGLAYTRLYDVTGDVGDLRQARAVLKNFYIEVQKDSSLGDPGEVEAQLKELDTVISTADEDAAAKREADRQREAELAKQRNDQPEGPVAPTGPDPGKKQRLGGIIGMAAGGGIFAFGGVLGAFYLIKGQQFSEELTNIRTDQDKNNCPDANDPVCVQLGTDEQRTIDNGRLANTLSLFVGIPMAVVGGAGAAVGAVLFVKANKKTKAWKRGEVVILPTPRGLSISGRF